MQNGKLPSIISKMDIDWASFHCQEIKSSLPPIFEHSYATNFMIFFFFLFVAASVEFLLIESLINIVNYYFSVCS